MYENLGVDSSQLSWEANPGTGEGGEGGSLKFFYPFVATGQSFCGDSLCLKHNSSWGLGTEKIYNKNNPDFQESSVMYLYGALALNKWTKILMLGKAAFVFS